MHLSKHFLFVTIAVVVFSSQLNSQSNPFFVLLDSITYEPIAGAHIISIDNKTTLFSNDDGYFECKENVQGQFRISHISYIDKTINLTPSSCGDTIFMHSINIVLPEVAIVSISKEKLIKLVKYNLRNYKQFYGLDDKTAHEGILTEKYLVKDTILRIFSAKTVLKTKNYFFRPRTSDKDNKLFLKDIYATKIHRKPNYPPMGFAKNSQTFQFMHLNVWLKHIKRNRKNIEINNAYTIDDKFYVDFNFNYEGLYGLINRNCILVFKDKKIVEIELNSRNNEDFRLVFENRPKQHYYKTDSLQLKLVFSSHLTESNKLISFSSLIYSTKKYKEVEFNTFLETTFYLDRLVELPLGNMYKELRLNDPIFKEIDKAITKKKPIPFSKKEQEFIDGGKD